MSGLHCLLFGQCGNTRRDNWRCHRSRQGSELYARSRYTLNNSLPEDAMKITPFINNFIQFIRYWNGVVCKCALCIKPVLSVLGLSSHIISLVILHLLLRCYNLTFYIDFYWPISVICLGNYSISMQGSLTVSFVRLQRPFSPIPLSYPFRPNCDYFTEKGQS